MLKRLNGTGRRKIKADQVSIELNEDGFPPAFTVTLSLTGLALPEGSRVIVEAYRASASERYDLGTLATLTPALRFPLREFSADKALLFRVMVVEPKTGRILALRQKIRPEDSEKSGRLPLLKVTEDDLGPEPWKTAFDEAEGALLVMNSAVPDATSRLKSSGAMQALILPAAFRQVLLRLWAEREELEDEDEPVGWRQHWMQFASNLAGDMPDAEGDWVSWIDNACSGFAKRHPNILNALVEGE